MGEDMDAISVIIPVYNLESCVRATLDSVVAATRAAPSVALECICVDDGSTDGSGAILDAYAARFGWIRVLHKANGGEGSARNAGLEAATGDWLAFLDGDDVWLPGILAKAAELTGRFRGADIVSFTYRPFDDGKMPPAETEGRAVCRDTRRRLPSEVILGVGVFPTFFRRGTFGALRFSGLPLGADRLYVSVCLAIANEIVMSESCVHGYRIRANSMARAVWNERKIASMVDFAAGSLRNLHGSGKRLGRRGWNYLAYVLTKFTAKYIRRMRAADGREDARRYWLAALEAFDPRMLPLRYRLWRRWYLLKGKEGGR